MKREDGRRPPSFRKPTFRNPLLSDSLGDRADRAGRNAAPALDAGIGVDLRLAVRHRDSLDRARSHTRLARHTRAGVNDRFSHLTLLLVLKKLVPKTKVAQNPHSFDIFIITQGYSPMLRGKRVIRYSESPRPPPKRCPSPPLRRSSKNSRSPTVAARRNPLVR